MYEYQNIPEIEANSINQSINHVFILIQILEQQFC